jgi:hypothetical protein
MSKISKYILSILILFQLSVTLNGCSLKNVGNHSEKEIEKEQALAFAKQVIETYFNNDCKTNYNFWADFVLIIGTDTKIKFKDHFPSNEAWCEKFNSKMRYHEGYIFEEYLKDYELRIYDKSAFTNLKLMKERQEDVGISDYLSENNFRFNDNDYYFAGSHLKDSKTEDKIILQGNWEMIVSKTDKGWKISGTLP